MSMIMNYTKAGMLAYLRNNLKNINILPIYTVKRALYNESKEKILDDIKIFSNGNTLIFRSSSLNEDTCDYSNAGKYETVLSVKPYDDSIEDAIEKVYMSYLSDRDEEILVQPMLDGGVVKSGVIFTKDIDTGADYYIVNYSMGNNTAVVTGGGNQKIYSYVQYRYSQNDSSDIDMENLIKDCNKISEFLKNDALDIEFAIMDDGTIYILQVRPIARGKKENLKIVDLQYALKRIYKKIEKLSKPHPFLLGRTTYFGVMPDWNPAEILGVRPKKLAISLYKELITDSIWAHQRKNYGYRDLTMSPLMISFCGVPYIDTRITFNSFIPQKLNKCIADKLVNYYLDKLAKYPRYHDKIEFEIVYSCYYLGIAGKLKELLNYGFNENEITRIEFSLLELTNQIINPESGLYRKDIEKIHILEKNYEKIIDSDISLVDKIYWLIEECKEYGTLPFAGAARAGFIAVQFLRSFVETGIITQDEYDRYMNSLDTINKQMNDDLHRYYEGQVSKEDFKRKYGHIRPGTYDIMSKRYDEDFNKYFPENKVFSNDLDVAEKFYFSQSQMERIQQELDENGLLISADQLMDFVKKSIESREYLKFVFTKVVSKILQLVEKLGNRFEIDRDDMAYVDISVIKQLYVDLYAGDAGDLFRNNIKNNKEQYEKALRIKLPSIILEPDNIYSFYLLDEEPNYVTQKKVTAEGHVLVDGEDDINGRIVFIRSADPGYDFIFTKCISGLITQFGGANSHMAIRCAELGIPAVIGVGENRFNEWSKYRMMELDCLKRQVIRIE